MGGYGTWRLVTKMTPPPCPTGETKRGDKQRNNHGGTNRETNKEYKQINKQGVQTKKQTGVGANREKKGGGLKEKQTEVESRN